MCDQLFANDDIFRYDLNLYKSGKTRVPCLIKRLGMVLRERRSAETLWAEGMYRTDSFSMNLYLRRSMADTRVHTKGFGERRRVSQATTLVLSENSTTTVVTGKKDNVRVLNNRRSSELQVGASHLPCFK